MPDPDRGLRRIEFDDMLVAGFAAATRSQSLIGGHD
jgi:hypothetical protein